MTSGGIRYTTSALSQAERTDERAPRDERARRRRRARLHLDRADGALHADVDHVRPPAKAREAREHRIAQVPRRALRSRLARRGPGSRGRRRTPARCPCTSARAAAPCRRPASRNALEDGVARDRRRQRQRSARQRLAEDDDVGNDVRLVEREALARAVKSRGDLVEHEQGPVLVAGATKSAERVRAVHPHPARALHEGLDHDARHVARDGRERGFERAVARRRQRHVNACAGRFPRTRRACRRSDRTATSWRTCRRDRRPRTRRRCRRGRPTLWNDCSAILSATSTATEPLSVKKTCRRRAGDELAEALRERIRPFVGEATERDVRHLLELLGHARANVRMPVAVRGGPPRGGPIDDLATVGQDEPAAARGRDR